MSAGTDTRTADGRLAFAATVRSLRRLRVLAAPEWRRLAAGSLFLAVAGAMELAYPQAIRVIMDRALGGGGAGAIDSAAFAMLVIFLVHGVAYGARYYLFAVSGERVVVRLRAALYRAIMAQEIAFFDARRTGELTNRLASDATVLQNTVSFNVAAALHNLAVVAGGIGLLFLSSPRLALVMLAVVPPLVVATGLFGRSVRALSRQFQDRLARSGAIAEETIAAIRTVRAFAQEAAEARRYEAASWDAYRAARRRALMVALFSGGASFAGYGAVAVVLWRGGHLAVTGAMSVGDLTSFILYTLIVAFSLGALGGLWADLMRSAGAAQRVFEILDRVPALPVSGGRRPAQVQGRLELEGVSFAYPSRPEVAVLSGVDLLVEPGEVIALVGPSGSGKSTLASLVLRFYDPSAGRVLLDGNDIRELDPGWLRTQVTTVSQEPVLLSTSVAQNIRYGKPDASEAEVVEAARAANAHEFVVAFPEGYDTLVGERGVQLSGGQKQRVAIARALLAQPRLLILDEATSALDADSEHLVREALERLMRGRTTLIIAHRLSTVLGADRAVVLAEGRIIESGSHRSLMTRTGGTYRRLVERQLIRAG